MKLCTALLAVFTFASFAALAQNPTDFYNAKSDSTNREYTITLKDGTKLRGAIIFQDATSTRVRTQNMGEVTLNSDAIEKMERVPISTNPDAIPNLFPHRLLWSPTAYSPERNQLYLNTFYYIVPDLTYGVTDRFSIGLSTILFAPTSFVNLHAKVTLAQTNNVAFALQGNLYAIREGGGAGLAPQAILSIGTPQRNTTLSLSYFTNSNGQGGFGLFTLGFVGKPGPKLTLISQNHLILGSDIGTAGLASLALRFDRKQHAFDVGLMSPFGKFFFGESIQWLVLPYVGFNIRLINQTKTAQSRVRE